MNSDESPKNQNSPEATRSNPREGPRATGETIPVAETGTNVEMGENDRAREWITRVLVVGADDPLTQYNIACGYTKLGETEKALDLLERMLPHVGEEIRMWIKHDSDFEALHGHPRFQSLLKSIT